MSAQVTEIRYNFHLLGTAESELREGRANVVGPADNLQTSINALRDEVLKQQVVVNDIEYPVDRFVLLQTTLLCSIDLVCPTLESINE